MGEAEVYRGIVLESFCRFLCDKKIKKASYKFTYLRRNVGMGLFFVMRIDIICFFLFAVMYVYACWNGQMTISVLSNVQGQYISLKMKKKKKTFQRLLFLNGSTPGSPVRRCWKTVHERIPRVYECESGSTHCVEKAKSIEQYFL